VLPPSHPQCPSLSQHVLFPVASHAGQPYWKYLLTHPPQHHELLMEGSGVCSYHGALVCVSSVGSHPNLCHWLHPHPSLDVGCQLHHALPPQYSPYDPLPYHSPRLLLVY
jgi:hypothetical protein